MKRTLLLFLVITSFSFTAPAQSIEQKIQERAIEHIKKNMNDPDSFEFVELKRMDTTLVIDTYNMFITPLAKDVINI